MAMGLLVGLKPWPSQCAINSIAKCLATAKSEELNNPDSNTTVERDCVQAAPAAPMHKAVLMTLLAAVSSSAAAELVWLGDTSDAAIYFDTATIQWTGDIANMAVLYDLKTPVLSETNGHYYASQRLQSQYDCKEGQWRMLHFSWYSKNMGGGKMVEHVADSFQWKPVPPGSGVEALWKLACGKR